jgi:hypothetical protein
MDHHNIIVVEVFEYVPLIQICETYASLSTRPVHMGAAPASFPFGLFGHSIYIQYWRFHGAKTGLFRRNSECFQIHGARKYDIVSLPGCCFIY